MAWLVLCCIPMNVTLAQAAAALNANSRWQEMISENMAGSSTPGFHRTDVAFDSVQAGVMAPSASSLFTPGNNYLMPKATSRINFDPGSPLYTGNDKDVSIDGAGFFEFQAPNGQMLYSRAGNLHMDTQGQLVNGAGYAIIGESGPIQLDPTKSGLKLTIKENGDISQGTEVQVRGRLKAVTFNDPQLLKQLPNGSFMATDPNLQPQTAEVKFRQSTIEESNTSSLKEMVHLISAMRTYEANQRIIQINDDRMSRSITDLGNTN